LWRRIPIRRIPCRNPRSTRGFVQENNTCPEFERFRPRETACSQQATGASDSKQALPGAAPITNQTGSAAPCSPRDHGGGNNHGKSSGRDPCGGTGRELQKAVNCCQRMNRSVFFRSWPCFWERAAASGWRQARRGQRLCHLLLSSLTLLSASAESTFTGLAQRLTESLPSETINVAVGNFVYEDTQLLSPFSSFLRDEMELALQNVETIQLVTRDRLADLQLEGKFQQKSILEPGTGVANVRIAGVKAIVRGRFYVSNSLITVFAEWASLEGGAIRKEKVEIPLPDVKARVWPDDADPDGERVQAYMAPQNMEKSLATVQSLASSRLSKINDDFYLEVFTVDGKRAYEAGDCVSFRVRSARPCHIAVLCHQADGTTVVLFPNRWCTDTFIPANTTIDIPGTRKSGFEVQIGPPFGSDVIEVIGCTQSSALHQSLARNAALAETFYTVTRGMVVKQTADSLPGAGASSDTALLWSQDSLVVSSFPKR
jgi:hypothetical protein